MLPRSLKANTRLCYWVSVRQVFVCIKVCIRVCVCVARNRTHNLLAHLLSTHIGGGRGEGGGYIQVHTKNNSL